MYLRLSVTDVCDFRCWYCFPTDGAPEPALRARLGSGDLLRLVRAVHAVAPLHKIRLTGGEPLLRDDLPEIIERLRQLIPDAELTLTTNGHRLAARAAALRAAGLDRINVSLDSVNPETFRQITGVDGLAKVRLGLAAARQVGFDRLKLNAVLLRSGGGNELSQLLAFAAAQEAELRFIELMPLGPGADRFEKERITAAEVLARLQQSHEYLGELPSSGTAERYLFSHAGREVVVGFIASVSRPFCARCDRLRLDSRGRLWPCLRRRQCADLALPLERGGAAVERAVRQSCATKRGPARHWPTLYMTQVGG